MAELLFFSTILLPLIGGITLLVFMRGEDRHRQIAISSVIAAFSLLMIVVTIMEHAPPTTFCLSWLASAGAMCVSFERSSLTLILFSTLPLLIILIKVSSTFTNAVERGLLLIAFAMLQVALVSDHFMLRYVALEFVGLCITAAALLFTAPREKRWSNTKQVFINLRIGDLTLLVAIFLMFTLSESFGISKNFDNALESLENVQMILSACLLTAIMVKMAVWPLDQWRNAVETVRRSGRIWLADICAPLLGSYLLYRSAPLLENRQDSLFPLILAIGCAAAILFQFRDSHKRTLLRHVLESTSLSLILAGFWIGQKSVWAFMLLWLLVRVFFFVWYELTGKPKSGDPSVGAIDASLLLNGQGFSFLIFWRISSQASFPFTVTAVLWALWWTQAIDGGMMAIRSGRESAPIETEKAKELKWARIIKNLLAGTAVFTALIFAAECIAKAVKGAEYSLFSGGLDVSALPISTGQMWMGLIPALVVILAARQIVKTSSVLERLQTLFKKLHYREDNAAELRIRDPLDIYEGVKRSFQKIAEFVYNRLERQGGAKIGEGLGSASETLFRSVEDFTSGNLWNRLLGLVVKSSQELQKMHHGMLRFNLIWLLVFIIGLSVFVWVWYTNGGGVV